MRQFKILIEETANGWEATVAQFDDDRLGPTSLLHAEPTVHDAVGSMNTALAKMTKFL